MNKFELVREVIAKPISQHQLQEPTLLDVGCRGCELKEYVRDLVQYSGVDLFQNSQGSVEFVLNVEDGLPIKDKSYDFVVALDLVEHLDDFQGGLEELLRVTRSYLIVMLPNLAYAPLRKEFLLSGSFSNLTDKYDLLYGKAGGKEVDRHRWLTVLPQAEVYMQKFANEKEVQLETIWFNDSKKRMLFASFANMLRLPPSCWVASSLYILNKNNTKTDNN